MMACTSSQLLPGVLAQSAFTSVSEATAKPAVVAVLTWLA